jgi:hypothetical protein
MSNLGTEITVVHEEYIEIFSIVNKKFFKAIG